MIGRIGTAKRAIAIYATHKINFAKESAAVLYKVLKCSVYAEAYRTTTND